MDPHTEILRSQKKPLILKSQTWDVCTWLVHVTHLSHYSWKSLILLQIRRLNFKLSTPERDHVLRYTPTPWLAREISAPQKAVTQPFAARTVSFHILRSQLTQGTLSPPAARHTALAAAPSPPYLLAEALFSFFHMFLEQKTSKTKTSHFYQVTGTDRSAATCCQQGWYIREA